MLRTVARAALVAARASAAQVIIPARGVSAVALENKIANAVLRGDKAAAAAARKALPAAKKAEAKKVIKKASGPTNAMHLFLAKELKGQRVGGPAAKTAHAKWAAMTAAEKKPFEDQAAKNRAKRDALKAKAKKPLTKYNKFFKANFPAAYKSARATKNHSDAFKAAAAEVGAKWKAQK